MGTQIIWAILLGALYWTSLLLTLLSISGVHEMWHLIGLALFIAHGILVGLVRNDMRRRCSIGHGDLVSDCLICTFVPFLAVSQFEFQLLNDKLITEGNEFPCAVPIPTTNRTVEETP